MEGALLILFLLLLIASPRRKNKGFKALIKQANTVSSSNSDEKVDEETIRKLHLEENNNSDSISEPSSQLQLPSNYQKQNHSVSSIELDDEKCYGRVVFAASNNMQVGKSEWVELLISIDLKADLRRELVRDYKHEEIKAYIIKIHKLIKARLDGNNFKIQISSEEIQLLEFNTIAEWRWLVIPQKAGQQELVLTLWKIFQVQASNPTIAKLKTFKKVIKVKVNPRYWIQSNWLKVMQILIAIASTGIVSYIYKNWSSIKKFFGF
ncbi:hypothetical protein Riv7116_0148 [Rivularia sp. PCC 7116]|uniref:hypothetical protein n=1 Tax=Rivularia sp. PCC 7116 TaxID=373994 RepID=UPI00029EEF66|nr:hypothetical protein [Rivularia sp. PCC 7116]AFY52757.1 hypothetical protein Riv7116_0148 [Rivularia sp. PCC 7116]